MAYSCGQVITWELMKLKSIFISITFGYLTEAAVLGNLRYSIAQHGHGQQRDTEASSGERDPSCTKFNVLPTLPLILLPTVALFFAQLLHPTQLGLFSSWQEGNLIMAGLE